ncbi:MAG: sulfatase, partial [Verrucomicrobiota bacterium]
GSATTNGYDYTRDAAIYGRERHYVTARAGNLPYPSRALRTKDFLYIRNFKPERWPMGDPLGLGAGEAAPGFDSLLKNTDVTMRDLDMGLTKAWLFTHRNDPAVKPLFELTLGKRPADELYDLRKDPHQMKNVASDPAYVATTTQLRERLMGVLKETHDPRLEDAFDRPPYVESKPDATGARGKRKGKKTDQEKIR